MGSVTFRVKTLAGFVAVAVLSAALALSFATAWQADAAPGDADSTYVPMTPCRLADTRPAPNRVGPSDSFGADDTKIIVAHRSNGDCTIPSDAVGLSLNITSVGATVQSFVTVWPNGDRPTAASLNPAPGQPPTPNAVVTSLSGTGTFSIYNFAGDVDLVIDVTGFYTRSSLQELVDGLDAAGSSRAELAQRLDAAESSRAELAQRLDAAESRVLALEADTSALRAAQPFGVTSTESSDLGNTPGATPAAFVSVEVTAPVDGQVAVHSTAHVSAFNAVAELDCAIFESTDIPAPDISRFTPSYQYWKPVDSAGEDTISSTRLFDIEANETIVYSYACESAVDGPILDTRTLTAIFTPGP